jgi:hypothetical protein
MNKDSYIKTLLEMSTDSLKALVIDVRAQVSAGLMTSKEAHEKVNCISAVLMTKEVEGICGRESHPA